MLSTGIYKGKLYWLEGRCFCFYGRKSCHG